MARHKKKTVNYFPHSCEGGKTLFILQESFGNDGYAFWFKLLELLGKTDNHFFDCRNLADFKFLQAITHTDEEKTCRILNLLCSLDAIDKELWQNRIIWCQNFVDNIKGVYLNRRVDIPTKPHFNNQNVISTPIKEPSHGNLQPETPQSKVKQNKVKKSKVKSEKSENDFPPVKKEPHLNGNSRTKKEVEEIELNDGKKIK